MRLYKEEMQIHEVFYILCVWHMCVCVWGVSMHVEARVGYQVSCSISPSLFSESGARLVASKP